MLGFPAVGTRKYGHAAEEAISSKLRECELRFLSVQVEGIAEAQSDLIRKLDPPMNDHPGQIPRWRIDEVRKILEVDSPPCDRVNSSDAKAR